MLRALIVDDERLARLALRQILEARSDVEIVGEAHDLASARQRLEELKPDLVFLDVEMPGGSGFELFRDGVSAQVVFCTAYEQFAVRAFEVNALDYLVKPVQPEHVERALRRAAQPRDARESLAIDDLVALREAHVTRFALVRDIVFIQAADDYSEVHLAGAPTALVNVTLRSWEERLPAALFVRIHRSWLIHWRHVETVQSDEVVLRGGHCLTVSRRKAAELRRRLQDDVPRG